MARETMIIEIRENRNGYYFYSESGKWLQGCKRQYLSNGQIFDLGNRKIEVVFTPGHTYGSVTFIDRDKHYGFSGDAFGSGNLLVFTNLSTEIKGCESIIPIKALYIILIISAFDSFQFFLLISQINKQKQNM